LRTETQNDGARSHEIEIAQADAWLAICALSKSLDTELETNAKVWSRAISRTEAWAPCSIGSGAQICPVIPSIHMVREGVGSRTISASLLCSFSLISRVMQRVTSITCLIKQELVSDEAT